MNVGPRVKPWIMFVLELARVIVAAVAGFLGGSNG